MATIFSNSSYGLEADTAIPTAIPIGEPVVSPIQTDRPGKVLVAEIPTQEKATGGTHLPLIQFLEKGGITPHSYQVEGIRWMDAMENDYSCGGILADDPGLGKTFQALALCHKGDGPNLIIVPTSILPQWIIEAERLFGRRNVYVHHGTYRSGTIGRGVKIVLSTYGLLRTDAALQRVGWDRVILDEAHSIKNRRSKLSKAAMSLSATFRWGLTGTPIQNKDKEAINLFRFTCGEEADANPLEWLVRERLLRRTKEQELGDQIPGITIQEHQVGFISQAEHDFYQRIREGVAAEYQAVQGDEAKRENMVMFELLLRMRQASQHPQLVMNGLARKFKRPCGQWEAISSKHQALLDILRAGNRQDTIVFCQFTEEMNLLEGLLSKEFAVSTLRGSSSVSHREHVIRMGQQTRQSGEQQRVFLVQIMAGGVGLNLQAFSQVVLMAPDWNPCNEIQAIARAHRLGQRQHVTVHKIILTDLINNSINNSINDTIDQRIIHIQQQKFTRISQLIQCNHTHTHTHTHTRTHTRTHFRTLLA